jgi:metal-responsive CopG/Arc/MetJ family transcriptional regulator
VRTIQRGAEMAKIAISLPSDVLAFIDRHADGNRSAYLTHLVREEMIRRYVQGYLEQPDTGEEYSEELAIEALSLDPYDTYETEPGQ